MIIRTIIQYVFQIVSLAIIADVLLSYFMSPFHPVRAFLDRLVEPLLNPIRRLVPALAGIDFSPVILIILLQVVENLLLRFIYGEFYDPGTAIQDA
jgi:YggT family protein